PSAKVDDMRRMLLSLVVVGVALLAIGAGVFVVRAKGPQLAALLRRSSAPAPITERPTGDPPKGTTDPAVTPRGAVTIDPRRQQLIGVRTVPATRTTLTSTIRTVGSVRSAETRLADVNVKLDG